MASPRGSRSRTIKREAQSPSRSRSRRSSGRRHDDNREKPNRKGTGKFGLGASFERRWNNANRESNRTPSEWRRLKKEHNDRKIAGFAWRKRRSYNDVPHLNSDESTQKIFHKCLVISVQRVERDNDSRPESYAFPDKSSRRSEEKPRKTSSERSHKSSKRVEQPLSNRVAQKVDPEDAVSQDIKEM